MTKQRLFCPDCGMDFRLLVDQDDEVVYVGCSCYDQRKSYFFDQLDLEMGDISTAQFNTPENPKKN